MQYTVFNQGYARRSFNLFVDAWLCAYFEFSSYCRIRSIHGEVWVVNPPIVN